MAIINVRVDDDLKRDAESVLNELGLNMTSAINVYLKAVVKEGGIPFSLNTKPVIKKAEVKQNNEQVQLDPLYPEIKEWLKDKDYTSLSVISRKFNVGFNRASRICESLINEGVIDSERTPKGNKVIK